MPVRIEFDRGTITLSGCSEPEVAGLPGVLWDPRVLHGGAGRIRTDGTLAGTPAFKAGAFDHSATAPKSILERGGLWHQLRAASIVLIAKVLKDVFAFARFPETFVRLAD